MLDFFEAWWESVQTLLERNGVTGRFQRTPKDLPNPSFNLNLRRDELEADLTVWESGEAELAIVGAGGRLSQQHFDDILKQPELGMILSRLTALAS